LMIAALLLTGMLASLHVSYRREEAGILQAAGVAPRRLVALWLAEAFFPLLAGTVAGVALGIGAAHLLVASLNRFWSDAVAATPMTFLLDGRSAAVAGGVALALALLAVYGGITRALRHPVMLLLGDQPEEAGTSGDRAWTIRNFSLGMGAAALAIALLAAGNRADAATAAGIFFGAGLLLLLSLLCWARLLAHFLGSSGAATGPVQAGIRNVTRHPGRSLLVMTLLATGSFLTVGILAMKHDPAARIRHTDSGSGGMTALVELTMPQPGGRCEERLRRALGEAGALLSFRVREGDEAGCLNLQRAQQPRLLGVALDEAMACRAFVPAGGASAALWRQLQDPLPDGSIPVLAGDRTTLEYGLHAQAGVKDGTVYTYAGEDGRSWRLRVVGALPVRTGVLQGSLLLNETILARMDPSAPGRSFWLVRHAGPEDELVPRLREELGCNGALVTPARERLRLLAGVEAAYLEMFLVLGGLGMALGAAGVGLVVLRQAATRRHELALFGALGLPVWQVWRYWMAEYLYLLVAGLTAGVLPALVAMQPALRTLGQELPLGVMAAVILSMGLTGLLGITIAVRATTRLPLPAALRGE
jgi:putative ABC transport system permease protein